MEAKAMTNSWSKVDHGEMDINPRNRLSSRPKWTNYLTADPNRKTYALTDGNDIYDVSLMNADELKAAQETANWASDGNISWEPAVISKPDDPNRIAELEAALYQLANAFTGALSSVNHPEIEFWEWTSDEINRARTTLAKPVPVTPTIHECTIETAPIFAGQMPDEIIAHRLALVDADGEEPDYLTCDDDGLE
jgi:hypothetical protein